jgi:hypothetical protein
VYRLEPDFPLLVHYCLVLGARQTSLDGKICPDIHLSCSFTETQPRVPLSSPTKHHPFFLELIADWITLDDLSGSGEEGLGQLLGVNAFSRFCLSDSSIPPLLASFNRFPMDCAVPSAISIPSLAVSAVTSAVALTRCPVEYPNIVATLNTIGPKISASCLIAFPEITSRFIPKKAKISKTSKPMIILLLNTLVSVLVFIGGGEYDGVAFSIRVCFIT